MDFSVVNRLLFLCLGVVWVHAIQPGPVLLSARLLGPVSHVTLAARLGAAGSAGGLRRTLTCLRLEEAPPTYEYAFPSAEQLRPFFDDSENWESCSESKTLTSVIESWDGAPATLCRLATSLLTSYTGDVNVTSCTKDADSLSPSAFVHGWCGSQLSAAWLRVASFVESTPSSVLPRRARQVTTDDIQQLQTCIFEHRNAALLSEQGGDYILVLGTTGVGKSTLVRFVTEKGREMKSVEDSPGNYLIKDADDTISAGVWSKTSVPELIMHDETKHKIYDFPGFQDTRGPCSDIVTASVLQVIAQSANSLKVILVIPFDSARSGSDRLGFISLLKHAVAFIKDPIKYKDAVGLVVSKVPNIVKRVKGKQQAVPDEDHRETVASFLRDVNATLHSNSDEEEFVLKASQLLEAILQEENASFSRIGLFRQPDEEGPLMEQELMQEAKTNLHKLFYNVLKSAKPEEGDFGLPLSYAAKVSVERLHSSFASRLESHVSKICLALKEKYRDGRKQLLDITAVQQQTRRDAQDLAAATKDLLGNTATVKTPRDFLRRLLTAVRRVHQGVPAGDFLASLNDTQVLELLDGATQDELEQYKPEKWIRPIQDLIRYVRGVEVWYRSFDALQDKLSEPDVRKNEDLRRQILQMQEQNFSRLVTITNPAQEIFFDLIKVQPDDDMRRDLTLLLNATLGPQSPTIECIKEQSGWSLKVSGYHLWMSDVVRSLRQGCAESISSVKISAEHTLYFDEDLHLHREAKIKIPAQLYIFSPRWYVIRKCTLSVDGPSGGTWPPLLEPSGQHGKAGQPGGQAGSIMGLAEDVVNGHLLETRAVGGVGGPGQNGARGRDGRKGRDGTIFGDGCSQSSTFGFLGYFLGSKTTENVGCPGAGGMDGGDGGVGGIGGPAGQILLICINKSVGENQSSPMSSVRQIKRNGGTGDGGLGGAGGTGGSGGLITTSTTEYFLFINMGTSANISIGEKQPDGKQGVAARSEVGRGLLDREPFHPTDSLQDYIVSVQSEFLNSLWDRVKAGKTRQILEKLDALTLPAGKECNAMPIVKQITHLERLRARYSQDKGWHIAERLVPRYQAAFGLLQQVLKQKPLHREVLITARAAVFTAIRALQSPAHTELVVNVKSLLESSTRTLSQYADSKKEVKIWEDFGTIRENITEKISKRKQLLDKHILPAILNAVLRLERGVRDLPTEIEKEEQDVQNSGRIIANERRRLRDAAFRTQTLGLLGFLGKAALALFSSEDLILQTAHEVASSTFETSGRLPAEDGLGETEDMFGAARNMLNTLLEGKGDYVIKKILSKLSKIGTATGNLKTGERNIEDRTSAPFTLEDQQKIQRPQQWSAGGDALKLSLSINEHTLLRREEWLREMEETAQKSILPLLDKMTHDAQQIFSGPNKVSVALALRSALADMRMALAPLTVAHGALATPRELQLCAELLDESLGVLVTLLEEIEEYREQFATDASIRIMTAELVSYGGQEKEEELQESVAYLKEAIRANLVLERYKLAAYSFTQWAFPFATEYMDSPKSSVDASGSDNATSDVARATAGLNELLESLEHNYAVVRAHESKIFSGNFEYPDPLHLWDRSQYGEQLDNLLDGKEVLMLANILESNLHKDAVKFNSVDLRLIALNKSRQRDLDAIFDDAVIEMTHMGDSSYRCGTTVFSISVASQTLSFTKQKDSKGSPKRSNGVYAKLSTGDMMLSPYALWKIKIIGPQTLFESLATFKGEVSLALEGHAQWVSDVKCDEKLAHFYQVEESKSEINVLVI